ncbi:MAG: MFS transporter [Candidatus Bilamarchaeaceae archaeon]
MPKSGSRISQTMPPGNRLIYVFGAMLLFFMLFDGIMSYLIPLVILEHGLSMTLIGVILSTAAISGAFFDFAIYRIFKDAFYRRLFMVMFAVAFVYISTVWFAETFLLYVLAMVMWGFYYDLRSFGTIDFISRYSKKKDLPSNFGIIQSFQSIGYLLAPLVAGFVIFDVVDWEPFVLAGAFLAVSAFFFMVVLFEARRKRQHMPGGDHSARGGFSAEVAGWKRVGRIMLPVLALAAFVAVFDSFFMAIGPLVAENLPLEPFDGLFMFAYFLPPMLIGGIIGRITGRFGEKKTALFGLLIGSLVITTIILFANPFEAIAVVFISACFTCMMMPVVQSIYGRCIHESPKEKKEVQELGDFATNFGYIIGPVFAGLIADSFGNVAAFSVLGAIGTVVALALLVFMPERFSIKAKKKH